ncbi:type II toxin-antitoxin system RelE/ParE family toxin [Marinicella gelatinilytica]|uniref:type II toxin-antitoxin system RelE/ParE family toxin n=1 Tax=Marinicella gelatinilytica TaxID=2996017 RepID=UPI002260F2AB|nr:type II toxin-antitoxin system RelE/ParE family toxin [Marinicella gelatinilytica]MCX7544495.1 type II toxin-antitoxin system RelE/ParE family toxin [Marinicella gelatinilytica]
MKTVVETENFEKKSNKIWTESEKEDFITWIAVRYKDGDVISGAQGVRKVRWRQGHSGKSGGVRVIYFNYLDDGEVWLLDIYPKNQQDNIKPTDAKKLKGDAK